MIDNWRSRLAAIRHEMVAVRVHDVIARHAVMSDNGVVTRCPYAGRGLRPTKIVFATEAAALACARELEAAGNNPMSAYLCRVEYPHWHMKSRPVEEPS